MTQRFAFSFRSWLTAVTLLFALGLWLAPATAVEATSNHTITIDGVNDFAGNEAVAATSGQTWYFTWDASNFYFGINGNPDVSSGSATKWVELYIDTDPQQTPLSGNGSSTGVLYNTQQPGLPFRADYHVRWKTDNSYTNMLDWNNGTSSWTDDNTGNNNFGITKAQSGNYLEVRIPRASLGNPTAVYVAGAMLNEAPGGEFTFFMTPNNNVEGYDANFTHYLGFNLLPNLAPNKSVNVDCLISYLVTSTAASGAGSLPTALSSVCDGSTVNFSVPANSTITLTAQATINRNLTINGASATNLSVSGGGTRRPLALTASAVVSMNDFTIRNGNGNDGTSDGDGGAIYAPNNTSLTLTRMTLTNNTVAPSFYGGAVGTQGSGSSLTIVDSTISNTGNGAGIAIFGTLLVNRSLFTNNTGFEGGGAYIDITSPSAVIANSTFANNTAYEGGGIRTGGTAVTLINNTIASNILTGGQGGGVYMTSGSLTMTNNLIGDNSSQDCDLIGGTISGNTNNLIESGTACNGGAVGLIQADPLLSPLANNGGPTQTMSPKMGSPVITKGDVTGCNSATVGSVDQRGQVRHTNVCDMGAYQTILVNSTSNTASAVDNVCAFVEAVTAVNSNAASGALNGECPAGSSASQDAISFFISGAGVQTLSPVAAWPAFTGPTGVDGLTQTGSSCASTIPTLFIQLNGTSAGAGANGLRFNANNSGLRGLIINRFNDDGVEFNGGTGGSVTCSLIGTNTAGTAASANGGAGVHLINANNIVVGGPTGNVNNVIAFNTGRGVWVESGSGNTIDPNSIHSNGGVGIDLGVDGVTANDSGDGDSGANALQNYPVLTSIVTSNGGASGTMNGTLNSTANTTFRLEFFGNTACDTTNFGEGELFIATQNVTTDGAGNVAFAVPSAVSFVGKTFIAGTATNLTTGNTSEFSACVRAQTPTAVTLVGSEGNGRYAPGVAVFTLVMGLATLAWCGKKNEARMR